jgi:hypothetical protein
VAFVFKVLGAETTKDPKDHGGKFSYETANFVCVIEKKE